MPLSQPVICPILVGRDESVEALTRIAAECAAGEGHVVLVTGDAGIGKSRLVAELRAALSDQGWRVLQGNCFEQDKSVPYAAWTDMLKRYARGGGLAEVARTPGAGGAELAALLPELRQPVGAESEATAQVDPPPAGEAAPVSGPGRVHPETRIQTGRCHRRGRSLER